MELIVAGFVKMKDRRALSDLLTQRRKILGELRAVTGINPERAAQAVEAEIAIIEAGLEESRAPAGLSPESEL